MAIPHDYQNHLRFYSVQEVYSQMNTVMKNNALICIIFSLIFTITMGIALAQEQMDVVFLHDGSKIVGTIIELVPNKSVKLRMKDGSELVFPFERVERIVREPDLTLPLDLKRETYSELGITLGTPGAVNLAVARWFGQYGVRVCGMAFDSSKGIQANIAYKFSDNADRSHSVALVFGGSKIMGKVWNYAGVAYNLNYGNFFLEAGLSAGSGSFSTPQLLLQLGYSYRFLP